ncbi:unnamed protein product [Paramecium primaurelia]|uniref:26 kDa periplasmic immunogenic protein n=1 Tax=Paramecium primaurelia TaxID=5886 RepID=A0A8S1N8G1_PARPR|nr:unnamed protein product [Paramecium primaurelia]
MIRILTIAICITLIFGSFIKDQSAINNVECSEVEHRRPDVFYVTGTGSLSVEPTIVTVNFAIEILNEFAEIALNTANNIQATAFKSLQSVDTSNAGVKISTTQFQMYPHQEYDYTNNGNPELKFKGYKVIISQKLETSNLKIVGKLIDAAINAGITNINNVSFDVKPEQKSELKDQILQLAIKDATHKAEIALKSLDMKIHSIKSISIDQQYAPRPMYTKQSLAMNSMDGAAAPTEIYAQEQNLQHSITVGFIIVPNDQ